MGIPKRKNNIDVYGGKEYYEGKQIVDRRQELLDRITKSDSYLPDSILHDDLDGGMLSFVKENFVITTDGKKIPVIPKILTIQRWGEFSNNWEFSDDDGNVELPFIAVIRKPDVQPGTNPVVQRTIPDRRTFYYASVPTWNGTQAGADIYKMPQPVAVDITFDVTIICNKFRDLNKFSKIVMQKFSSRQSYTTVKGHYIPIVLDRVEDNTPMETVDGRRFYIQNYTFTMLGFLIDSEEFEVKPAIQRVTQLVEIDTSTRKQKRNKYPENPDEFEMPFLFVSGNTVLTDRIDFTANMSLISTDNVDTFDVYINGDYYGSDLQRIEITTNDVLRIEVTKNDNTQEAVVKYENKLV